MSVVRSCGPCRAGKAKCDRALPTCGRCLKRGLTCSGLPAVTDFIFRDQNEASRRNSERARGKSRESQVHSISFDVLPSQVVTLGQQQQTSTDVLDTSLTLPLQHQYPRPHSLVPAELRGPRKRDDEAVAVDRFFANWTLHPGNGGLSPGYMHNLYPLYLSAPPGSILWLAVRAVACADMRHGEVGDISFHIKARQYYGAALGRLRAVTHGEHGLASDQILAAILLIDNFENMYLARTDPLGPHRAVLRYILSTAGDDYLFHQSSFALGCLAHKRLQTRQTLLREAPDPAQIMWVSKLNLERPDIHITADVLHMNILSAAVEELTRSSADTMGRASHAKVEQSRQLVRAIQDLIAAMEDWTSAVPDLWKPQVVDIHERHTAQPGDVDVTPDCPLARVPGPYMPDFNTIWLAYLWDFHAASQIVLRESLVEVINYSAAIQGHDPDGDSMKRIHGEQEAVDRLSSAIMRSFPLLLGFTRRPPFGKMAGRLFSLCSMLVVQKARLTSLHHKEMASDVIGWIHARHGLG